MNVESIPLLSRLYFEVAERGEQAVPNPLVWRGRPAFSPDGVRSSGVASSALALVSEDAAWLAVHAGVGPAKLLVSWAVAGTGAGDDAGVVPAAYVIESSASSTNGRDGEWRRELSVMHNAARSRAHVIEFDGQSWVRLGLPAASGSVSSAFERLDLHDASDGMDDCWLVLGDPFMAGLGAGPGAPGWAEIIHERYPGYFPAVIDETRRDEPPARTLERLDELLATHTAARRVVIAHGGASVGSALRADDGAALDAMVAAVLGSGRLPVLSRPPALGRAREAITALHRDVAGIELPRGLVSGPDLASWFKAHPDQLGDDGRPSHEGLRAIQHLWAEALDVWYVPQ